MNNRNAGKHEKICDRPPREDRGSLRMKIPIRPGTCLLLALGIVFIVIGAFKNEFETIWLNALILCASCIGLR